MNRYQWEVPVISADVGGQSEIINDNVGVIVKCLQNEDDVMNLNYTDEEVDSYVTGIEKILANLDYYKDNARNNILNGFTINQMIENMSKEFENLIRNPNKEKTLNGEKLANNENICLELITKYFIAFSNEYNWLVKEFNRKINYEVNKSVNNFKKEKAKNSENTTFRGKIKKIIIKLHIYNESMIIYKAVKMLIGLILGICKTTIKFVKYILIFLKLLCIRILNIFRKILKKEPISFECNDFENL